MSAGIVRIKALGQLILNEHTERDKHLDERYKSLQHLQSMSVGGDKN